MIPIRILYLFIFFLLICGYPGYAQKSKSQLEQEKKIALEKLKQAQKILDETEKKKDASIGQLNAINEQIKASQTIIGSITAEIGLINVELNEVSEVIESLENDLDMLKQEYALMMYTSQKASTGLRGLLFIFSAPTFNQLIRRAQYMKQYTEAREKQFQLIQVVRASLVQQQAVLEVMKTEKNNLLGEATNQNKNLVNLKNKQNNLISSLNKKEKEIKKELDDRQKAIARLDKLIADIVTAEIKASSKGKSTTKISLNEDQTAISTSFEKSYAKLQWPVKTGFISSNFGINPHPVYKKLQIPNDGIDIQTKANEAVTAVFNGKVKMVAVVPGEMKYVVLVQHGDYFTVYAKLKEVFVTNGQDITVNDRIGIVNTNKDGITELQFQIWKNNQKLNPASWIVKK